MLASVGMEKAPGSSDSVTSSSLLDSAPLRCVVSREISPSCPLLKLGGPTLYNILPPRLGEHRADPPIFAKVRVTLAEEEKTDTRAFPCGEVLNGHGDDELGVIPSANNKLARYHRGQVDDLPLGPWQERMLFLTISDPSSSFIDYYAPEGCQDGTHVVVRSACPRAFICLSLSICHENALQS